MLKKLSRSKFFCFVCGILLVLFMSLSLLTIGSNDAQAQRVSDLETVTVEASSKQTAPADATREAAAWATQQTAREHVIEILGQAAFEKNKAAISQKILRQTNRFIPFVNPGAPVEQRDKSWKVPVELKISTNSLRKLLVDEGFFGQGTETASNPASILPLITFTDRTKTQSLRWWTGIDPAAAKNPELKLLLTLQQIMHTRLNEEITKQQLVFTKPPASGLPQNLQVERPSSQDFTAIGAYTKTAMIARGDVRVLPSNEAGAGQITVKLQVAQAATPDRAIAEVVREFTSDPHARSLEAGLAAKASVEFAALAKDLSAQVQAAWQRGSVGTNYVTLSVRGPLNPQQQLAFKTAFVRTVHEVRDLKERVFERDLVTYEADYAGDLASFEGRLKTLRLAGFDMRVGGSNGERGMVLDVRANNQLN